MGIARNVLLTKLVLIDSDLRPYLATQLVAALYKAGDMIRVSKKGDVTELIEKEHENFLENEGTKIYNNYSILMRDYCLHILLEEPVD